MIKIEVTGNTIPELADKLLAIGANLRGSAIVEGARGAVKALQALEDDRGDLAKRLAAQLSAGVAEAAPVDPTPAPKSAPVAEATESLRTTTETSSTPAPASNTGATAADVLSSQPTTKEPSTTPAPAPSASEDEELEVVDLPIAPPADEIDLRALVLKVVETRGKPFMEGILTSFGVVKASHVEAARLPELIARCQEALGK
jgi:hypothetical protein